MIRLIFLQIFVSSLNFPFIVPNDFEEGQELDVLVKNLFSSETQLPFEYFYLNFCKPKVFAQGHAEDIGKILSGDSREISPYHIKINSESTCQLLCSKKNSKEQQENFKWMIDNEYYVSLILDNLPSALRISHKKTENLQTHSFKYSIYQDGFQIGFRKLKKYYIYNHLILVIKLFVNKDSFRVVGFLVEPLSLQNEKNLTCSLAEFKQNLESLKKFQEKIIPPEDSDSIKDSINEFWKFRPQELTKDIQYSYTVLVEYSNIKWASRWDMYLYGAGKRSDVHWLSIINSFSLVLFLSGIIAQIMCRTIRKHLQVYNETDMLEARETGWKQIRGEIFKRPEYPMLFCAIIGTGLQIVFVSLFALSFACMGFLIPEYRGEFVMGTIYLYLSLGFVSGYTSSRLYKMFDLHNWRFNLLLTATLFPLVSLITFCIINFCVLYEESSGAVPFFQLFFYGFPLWCILLCSIFLGGGVGKLEKKIENPCEVNEIPRQVYTKSSWKVHFVFFLAGSLPFGCMFIELSYVMKSMWHHSLFYYLFGFLYLCFFVLMITSAEVSILMTYLLLCMEDHRWWWISFEVSGASGVYFFIYAFFYYYAELTFSRLSSFVFYFGYMFLVSATYTLITGTIGFLATFVFIRTIYSLIKSD